jgi:hypothetical protein
MELEEGWQEPQQDLPSEPEEVLATPDEGATLPVDQAPSDQRGGEGEVPPQARQWHDKQVSDLQSQLNRKEAQLAKTQKAYADLEQRFDNWMVVNGQVLAPAVDAIERSGDPEVAKFGTVIKRWNNNMINNRIQEKQTREQVVARATQIAYEKGLSRDVHATLVEAASFEEQDQLLGQRDGPAVERMIQEIVDKRVSEKLQGLQEQGRQLRREAGAGHVSVGGPGRSSPPGQPTLADPDIASIRDPIDRNVAYTEKVRAWKATQRR